MSKLLIQESPLQVLPSLACKIGLTPAILLQQLHYLLQSSKERWISLSWNEWKQRHFPFFSISTLRINFEKLVKSEMILIQNTGEETHFGRGNKNKFSINYEKLAEFEQDPGRNMSKMSKIPEKNLLNLSRKLAENEQDFPARIYNNNIYKEKKRELTNQCFCSIFLDQEEKIKIMVDPRENEPMDEIEPNKQKQTNVSKNSSWPPGRMKLYQLLFAFKSACGDSMGLGHLIQEKAMPEDFPGRLKEVSERKWKEWLKTYAMEHQVGIKELESHLVALGTYMNQRKPLQIRDKNTSLEELLFIKPQWLSLWMQEALSSLPLRTEKPKIIVVQEAEKTPDSDPAIIQECIEKMQKFSLPLEQ